MSRILRLILKWDFISPLNKWSYIYLYFEYTKNIKQNYTIHKMEYYRRKNELSTHLLPDIFVEIIPVIVFLLKNVMIINKICMDETVTWKYFFIIPIFVYHTISECFNGLAVGRKAQFIYFRFPRRKLEFTHIEFFVVIIFLEVPMTLISSVTIVKTEYFIQNYYFQKK